MTADDVQQYQGQFAQLDHDHDGYVLVRGRLLHEELQIHISSWHLQRICRVQPAGWGVLWGVHAVGFAERGLARHLESGGWLTRPARRAAVHLVLVSYGQHQEGV